MAHARRTAGAVAAIAALALSLAGCGDEATPPAPASAAAPPAGPPAGRAPVLEPPATPAEKAAYWLDRLVSGPETSEVATDWIADYHQAVLTDAVLGLAATPVETTALLADPERRTRLTTQEDTNPWHGVLDVLAQIGRGAPDVARAWAAPAASHRELVLRRRALGVYAPLADPKDAPVFLEALRRDGGDPVVAPTAVRLLLSFGADAARAAARAVYEHGSPELWFTLPGLVDAAWGEHSADLLRWWAALAEGSGPRAHVVARPDGDRREASNPAAGPVVGPEHWLSDGRASAAQAREALKRRAGGAAETVDPAAALARLRDAALGATSDTSSAILRALLEAVAGLAPAPADGPDDAAPLLERVVTDLRPVEVYRPAIEAAFDALVARGRDVAALLERLLSGSGEDSRLGVFLVRKERNPARVPLVRSALAGAAGSRLRHELRALLIWLHAAALEKGGIDVERLAAFAREVADWVAEGGEGTGFTTSLLDLGPPGEQAYEVGLRGKDRDAYLRGIPDRTVAPAVIAAVLAQVTSDTPPAERHLALAAAFRAADASAEPALVALAGRLSGPARAEALLVARHVRHRARPPGR